MNGFLSVANGVCGAVSCCRTCRALNILCAGQVLCACHLLADYESQVRDGAAVEASPLLFSDGGDGARPTADRGAVDGPKRHDARGGPETSPDPCRSGYQQPWSCTSDWRGTTAVCGSYSISCTSRWGDCQCLVGGVEKGRCSPSGWQRDCTIMQDAFSSCSTFW